MPTVTDLLIAACTAELESKRLWLDSLDGLRSVQVTVKLTRKDAVPIVRAVLMTQETETVHT